MKYRKTPCTDQEHRQRTALTQYQWTHCTPRHTDMKQMMMMHWYHQYQSSKDTSNMHLYQKTPCTDQQHRQRTALTQYQWIHYTPRHTDMKQQMMMHWHPQYRSSQDMTSTPYRQTRCTDPHRMLYMRSLLPILEYL